MALWKQFLNQIAGFSPFVDDEEDEADIDTDATLQVLVEGYVARHGLPVAVEGQPEQFAAPVEHGRAGVAARDVVVGEKAEMHVARRLVGIASPLALLHQRDDVVLQLVVFRLRLPGRLVEQALGIGVVAVVRAARGVVLYDAIREAHGEVRVAVVRRLLVHLQQGLRQEVLVPVDGGRRVAAVAVYLLVHRGDVCTVEQAGVRLAQRTVGEQLVHGRGIEADGACKDIVGVCLFAAPEEAVDGGIAGRPEGLVGYLLPIVAEQCRHRRFVELRVVVLEERLHAAAHRGGLRAVGILGHRVEHAGQAVELDAPHERLEEEARGIDIGTPAAVGLLKVGEHLAEAFRQVGTAPVPLAHPGLQLLLLRDDAQIGNCLVHAYAVLPVIAAACPFAGVLDAHGTVGIHEAFPHLLLLAAHLYGTDVSGIHTLVNAPRAQVAARAARIAYRHAEIAAREAVAGYACEVPAAQRHVLGAVVGRIAVLVGIDAEHAEVARLARPHPVVGVAPELAQRLRSGEDEAYVAVRPVETGVEGIASIVAFHHAFEARAGLLQLLLHGSHDAVRLLLAQFGLRLVGMGLVDVVQCLHDAVGAILRPLQELHEEAVHGAFLLAFPGYESVGQDVVLRRGEALYGTVSAVVVGEDQPVPAHHDARAEVAEVNHAVLQAGVFGAVELVGRELQAEALHCRSRLVVDLVQHPHTFVGTGKEGGSAEGAQYEELLHGSSWLFWFSGMSGVL